MQREIEVTSKFDGFCALCTRKYYAGETIKTFNTEDYKKDKTHINAKNKAVLKFFVHLDCKDEEVRLRMTKMEFLKTAKRTVKNGARRSKQR